MPPAPVRARSLRESFPTGRALTAAEFRWRHRVVCVVLAAHVPVLVLLGALIGEGLLHGLSEATVVVALLGVALAPVPRRAASLSATLGLLTCSAMLVAVTDGAEAAPFHYFVAVALVALYQDWVVLAVAVGFVGLQDALVGLLGPDSGAPGEAVLGAAMLAAALFAECAVLVVFWHADERARDGEERLAQALYEGQHSVQSRLQETDRIRTDLIATVSHEFRTPLTGIRGAALTLLKRGDRLDPGSRERMLQAVLDQQERLSRLLENMLTASRATSADPGAVTDVLGVATEVAMLAGAERRSAPPVSVLVDRGCYARIDRQALHQVLANLVDNAQVHGAQDSVPLVTGGRDERGVWVAVSNDGSSMDIAAASRMFEPFSQADSGITRTAQGIGMGLYVVRRLVDVYGGDVEVRSEGGWVTVEVRLSAAEAPVPAPR